MAFRYLSIKQQTRLLVDEALSAVRAGFREDEAATRQPELAVLEQRLLMSATPAAVIAEAAVETPTVAEPATDNTTAQESFGPGTATALSTTSPDSGLVTGVQQTRTELVVIDPAADHHEQLVADLQAQSERTFEILVLNPREDGIAQITDALQKLNDVSALHLVSHGEEGEILLGTSVLSQRTIDRYAAELVTWQDALSSDADLLIYGCDLAASDEGIALTESLNTLLGTDVAASNDDTGQATLGGDWVFEQLVGDVQTDVAFSANLQANWQSVLSTGPAPVVNLASTGEFLVNQTVGGNQQTTSDVRGSEQSVAVAGNGDYVVVWTSDQNSGADGDGQGVLMRRFNAFGVPLSGEIQVNQQINGDQFHASVAVDESGRGVVVWRDDNFIMARVFDADNGFSGPEFRVNSSTSGTRRSPTVDMQANGNFIVAWSGEGNNGNDEIYYRRYLVDGTAVDGAEVRANGSDRGTEEDPTVAVNDSGQFVLAWQVGGRLYLRHFDSDGTAAHGDVRVENDLSFSWAPDVDINNSGDSVLVYRESGAFGIGAGVWGRAYNHDGSTRGDYFSVSSGSSDNTQPSVALTDDGSFLVVYHGDDDGDGDQASVKLRKFDASSSAVTSSVVVNETSSGDQRYASIAAVDADNFVVVWSGQGQNAGHVDTSGVFARQYGNAAAAATTSTITVDTTSDALDGDISSITALYADKGADGRISLREAIRAANNTANGASADRIEFDIPEALVNGAHTIEVLSDLHDITEAVVIDGTTDPDFVSTPIIVLNGAAAGAAAEGLTLGLGSDGSTVRGLSLVEFERSGIFLKDSDGHTIVGNYLGTDQTGTTDRGNTRHGIDLLESNGNTIGGTSVADRNVILGNNTDGIHLLNADNNTIIGNSIGLLPDASGALGHDDDGIELAGTSSGNQIGGTAAGAGNVIAGNANNGLEFGGTSGNNFVQGNWIGVAPSGLAIGNATAGIRLHTNAADNVIGGTAAGAGNTIAFNGASGVSTSGGATRNLVIGNEIRANGGLGIDVGHDGLVTVETTTPVLTLAQAVGGDLRVQGTVSGTAGAVYKVAIYASATADATGHGEAEEFLGTFDVTIPATGTATAAFDHVFAGAAVPVGRFVTATAADAGGTTTEFAANVTVSANQAPVASIAALPAVALGQDVVLDGTASSDPEGDTLLYRWDLDNDGIFGEVGEPDSANPTVTAADLASFGLTGAGNYTIGLQVEDAEGATSETTTSLTITSPAGSEPALWISTAGAASTSAARGGQSWTGGSLVELTGPGLSLGADSDGTFLPVVDLGVLFDDGETEVNAMHVVASNITLGTTHQLTLRPGDVLFSVDNAETLGGGSIAVADHEVLLYRPDSPGNYASGTLQKVLNGLNTDHGVLDIQALTLIERDTVVGDVTLSRGDFLLTRAGTTAEHNDVFLFRTTDVGAGTTDGTFEKLVEGDDVNIAREIRGVELVEQDVTVGGQTLTSGQLLLTVSGNDSVGDNNRSVKAQDLFELSLTATNIGATTAAGNAALLVDGGDIDLNGSDEQVEALSLAGVVMNAIPDVQLAMPASIAEGQSLTIDASGSSDADGDPLTYAWDLNYDGTFSADVSTASRTLSWAELSALGIADDGDYTIALRVSDGTDTVTVTSTLNVQNTAPTYAVTGDAQVVAGEAYTLSLNISDPGDDTLVSWTVNWGDGDVSTYSATQTTVTHVYSNAGFTNNISVSVRDEDGVFANGQLVATGNAGNQLYLNDGETEQFVSVAGNPVSIIQGPDGYLYVSNFGSHDIDRYDPVTGGFVDRFVIETLGGLQSPSRMAFGPDGTLYVSSFGSDQVLRYGSDGRSLGVLIDGLNNPDGLTFDRNGDLYVSEQSTGNIYRYNAITGEQIGAGPFASFGKATFISLQTGPGGNLYASSTVDNVIREFDAAGNTVGDFGGGPLADLTSAAGFAWGPAGRLYVADYDGDRIGVYSADGTFVETIGGTLNGPLNLVVTADQQVRVTAPPATFGENYTVSEGGNLSVNTPSDWFNSNWQYRREVTFDNSGGQQLNDAQVLVRLHATDADAVNIDYAATRDAGEDLRFVDADGTLLDHQIEVWDEAGSSYVWVEVPQIDAASTTDSIFLYYGNASAGDGAQAAATWGTAVGIYHLNATSLDATAPSSHGQISNVVVADGIVGAAGRFNGTDSQIRIPATGDSEDLFAGGGTVSAWINPEGFGENGFGRIVDKATTDFAGGATGNGWAFQVGETAGQGFLMFEQGFSANEGAWRTDVGSIDLNTWQHVAVVYDSSSTANTPQLFINGVSVAVTQLNTPSGTLLSDSGVDLVIGNYAGATSRTFDGRIDEVRISREEVSARQLAVDYESVAGAFVSATSAVEAFGAGVLANDTDADGDRLTVSLVSGPSHSAAFTLRADGSFSYTHDGSETTADSFRYTVSDGTTTSAPVTVSLNVTPVNDPPSVSAIASQSLVEDSSGTVAFSVGDADDTAAALIVTATSGNPALIADADIRVLGSGSNRTLELTPLANATGTAVITLTVSDGTASTSTSFQLTVSGVNDAPTLSAVSDVTTPEDTPFAPVSVTVGDAETAATALLVTATSSDPSLIRNSDIVVTGNGAHRSVQLTPRSNQSGTATITLSVSDGTTTTSTTFAATVTSVNDRPDLQPLADLILAEDTDSAPILLEVSDVDNNAADLTVTAVSSDQSLVRDADLVISGTGSTRSLVLRGAPGASGGPATITVTVSDGLRSRQRTFEVTITPVNDAPSITPLADVRVTEGTTSIPISLEIDDADDLIADLTVTVTSSDQAVLADSQIQVQGTGRNRVLRLRPDENAFGTSTVTITVSDGRSSTVETFELTMESVNDAPVIAAIADVFSAEDDTVSGIKVLVRDVDSANADLIVTAISSDQTMIADSAIQVTHAGGGARLLSFTPQDDMSGGPVEITVSVSDGDLVTRTTFQTVISPVNDVPEFLSSSAITFRVPESLTLESGVGALQQGVIDAEGDEMTVRLVSGPAHGELTLQDDGTFRYVANSDFAGLDKFEFVVTDGMGDSVVKRVRLRVPEVVVIPSALLPVAPTAEETADDSEPEPEPEETTVEEDSTDGEENTIAESMGEVGPEDMTDQETTVLVDETADEDDEPMRAVAVTTEVVAGPQLARPASGALEQLASNASSTQQAEMERVFGSRLSSLGVSDSTVGLRTASDPTLSALFTSTPYETFYEIEGMVEQLDHFRDELGAQIDLSSIAANVLPATGATVIVGSVVTAIRTGVLALGFLTQLPVWTMFDPLMVMDGVGSEEGDSLEEIVDRNAEKTSSESRGLAKA